MTFFVLAGVFRMLPRMPLLVATENLSYQLPARTPTSRFMTHLVRFGQ